MKTTRMISLLLALCFVLLLAGCGAAPSQESEAAPEKTPEDLATETVTGLMDSLVAGTPADAEEFCSDEVWKSNLFDEFFDPEDLESAYEYMGITEESGIDPELLGEETEASVVRFIETYNDAMFKDYEITDLSVDGDTGEAVVHVTYGIDPEKISAKDPSELVTEEEQDAIYEEHSEEIQATLESEGEGAAMAILYNALLPKMMDAMCEFIETMEPSEEDWNITLEKVEDAWQITSIKSA